MYSTSRYGLLLLLAASFSLSSAATIRSLVVRGNTVFTSREITGWLASRPGVPYVDPTVQNDCRIIADAYRARGYLASRVAAEHPGYSPDSASTDISITIEEGRQTLIGRLSVGGSLLLTELEILERFDIAAGDPLNESLLEQDIDALLGRYERLGYPFARCEVQSMECSTGAEVDSVTLTLRVEEGRQMTIDEIRVEGNKETDTAVIVRETRLESGELFNPVKVGAIKQRLSRLNIFASVAEPELYVRENRGGLRITVREGNTNTFDGVLGYIPSSTPGESGYLTGLASVSMRNLFGSGRKLSFRWQREDRSSQEIGVRYVEPWLFGAPMNLGGGFFQRQQDSSYVRRTLDCKAEVMLAEDLSVSLIFNTDRVIPSSDSSGSAVFGTTSTTGGVEVQYDTRDDVYSPLTGVRYRTDYHYGRKAVQNIPAFAAGRTETGGTLQKLGVDLDVFISTFRLQVVAVGVHGREVRTGQVQESDMYRFGGTNTLRGYRENQFLGSRVAWTNLEYRFLLARRSFFYGFMDTGYFYRPADDVRGLRSSEAFRYGYGIGIRLDTPLGNMGVSLALGQGDSIGSGKIHFGLVNEF